MIFSVLRSPSLICEKKSSSVTFMRILLASAFCSSLRCATNSRAIFSSLTTWKTSPADGTSDNPTISTGIEGPASLIRLPLSSVITRTRPTAVPATTTFPACSVPFCTKTVATGPRPLSSLASITVPLASRFGLARNSCISATSKTISNSWSNPSLVAAETGTQIVSPPQASGTSSYSVRFCKTRSKFDSGLSILLTATTIGTPAALAWLIASTVCGIMPSSPATTKITTSVTCAPRARIEVNAACPGVSKNVISRPFTCT